jgi:hypothetical protein
MDEGGKGEMKGYLYLLSMMYLEFLKTTHNAQNNDQLSERQIDEAFCRYLKASNQNYKKSQLPKKLRKKYGGKQ